MDAKDTSAVLEKVRKLLALANNEAATEGERDNALRMTHGLLTNHNLDLADVDEHTRNQSDPRGVFTVEGWSLYWSKHVRKTIAEFFYCRYYFGDKVNGTRCNHHFVGRESNATTAMYMSEFIITSILKEGRKRYGHNLAPQTRNFAEGARWRLASRCAELRRIQKVEASTSTAVALIDIKKREEADNDAYIKAAGTNLTASRRRMNITNDRAFQDGTQYGDTIGLDVQVTQNRRASVALE